jgi:hypothetical protein
MVEDRLPPGATCVIMRADPGDRTLGHGFDAMYETTARPCEYLWGPGTWSEGAQWLKRESPAADEIAVLDRLFLLRHHDGRLYMPRTAPIAAALGEEDRPGTWYLLRADYPADASAISGRSSPEYQAMALTASAARAPQRPSPQALGRT